MTAIIFLIVLLIVCVLGARYGVDSRFDRPGRQPRGAGAPGLGVAVRQLRRRWRGAASARPTTPG